MWAIFVVHTRMEAASGHGALGIVEERRSLNSGCRLDFLTVAFVQAFLKDLSVGFVGLNFFDAMGI